jgi:hypothetical protein
LKSDSFGSGIDQFAAGNLDDAIDLLNITSTDKANGGKVEKHPERRMKSAYAEFEEEEMPKIKEDSPNLRLSQLKQKLQKVIVNFY